MSWCIVIIILDKNNYYLKIKTRVNIEIDAQFSSITFDILSWASSEPNESSPYLPIISLILSSQLHVGLPNCFAHSDFWKETPYGVFPLRYLLHVPLISSLI